jgi:hypothetical protein
MQFVPNLDLMMLCVGVWNNFALVHQCVVVHLELRKATELLGRLQLVSLLHVTRRLWTQTRALPPHDESENPEACMQTP